MAASAKQRVLYVTIYFDALPPVVLLLFGACTQLALQPAQYVVEGLGAGDGIERRG